MMKGDLSCPSWCEQGFIPGLGTGCDADNLTTVPSRSEFRPQKSQLVRHHPPPVPRRVRARLLPTGRTQLGPQLPRCLGERVVPATIDAHGNIPEAVGAAERLVFLEIVDAVEGSRRDLAVLSPQRRAARAAR